MRAMPFESGVPHKRCLLCLVAVLWCVLTPSLVDAADRIILLGPADDLALDQPRITFGLVEPGTANLVGPQLYNSGLLDTGANGVLLAELSYAWEEDYGHAIRGDSSWVEYVEQGVAGPELLDVLPVYDLVFEGSDTEIEFTVPNVTAMGSPTLDIGSFAAIVGMPAMVDRVTILDLQPMLSFELIGVEFAGAAPPTTGHSYHMNFSMLAAEYTGQLEPGDPLPTFNDLPMIDAITVRRGALASSGPMVLDTGSQMTIITSAAAIALDIDYLHTIAEGGDVVDTVDVGGVGGAAQMPLVYVDRLTVPTAEGVDLALTDVAVGVLDIPGISGVFGMNLLTSGYFGPLLGLGGDPYVDAVVLDFLDPAASTMRLDLNALLDEIVWLGDYSGDDAANLLDINPFVLALTDPTTYGAIYPDVNLAAVDPSGNGVLNLLDINPFVALVVASGGGGSGGTSGGASGGVPEPTAALIIFAALAAAIGGRRCRSRLLQPFRSPL